MSRTYPYAVNTVTGEICPLNPMKVGFAIAVSRQLSTPEIRHAELVKMFDTVFAQLGKQGLHVELRGGDDPEKPTEPILAPEMAKWCVEYDAFVLSPEGKAEADRVMGDLVAAALKQN